MIFRSYSMLLGGDYHTFVNNFESLFFLIFQDHVYVIQLLFHISRKNMTRGGVASVYCRFGTFFVYKTFPSPQKVSGSYKNSYRKLRVCTFKSKNLVNGCWPFRQHIHSLFNCIAAVKSLIATSRKVILEVYTVRWVRIRDIRLVYYRSWHL